MFNKIALKHAERRREKILKALSHMQVSSGWIKYIRTLFGLTLKELGQLTSLSVPTIAQAEKREAKGKVTIETLRKLADAMECDFTYAFIPRENINSLLKNKALKKARESIIKADIHMGLEDQKVKHDLEERVEMLAEKLLEKGKVW